MTITPKECLVELDLVELNLVELNLVELDLPAEREVTSRYRTITDQVRPRMVTTLALGPDATNAGPAQLTPPSALPRSSRG